MFRIVRRPWCPRCIVTFPFPRIVPRIMSWVSGLLVVSVRVVTRNPLVDTPLVSWRRWERLPRKYRFRLALPWCLVRWRIRVNRFLLVVLRTFVLVSRLFLVTRLFRIANRQSSMVWRVRVKFWCGRMVSVLLLLSRFPRRLILMFKNIFASPKKSIGAPLATPLPRSCPVSLVKCYT